MLGIVLKPSLGLAETRFNHNFVVAGGTQHLVATHINSRGRQVAAATCGTIGVVAQKFLPKTYVGVGVSSALPNHYYDYYYYYYNYYCYHYYYHYY